MISFRPLDQSVYTTRRQALAALAATFAPRCLHAASNESVQSTRLRGLAERYFAEMMDSHPLWASWLGMATDAQASRLGLDIAPAWRARQRQMQQRTLAALGRIDRAALGEADGITYDVFRFRLEDSLARDAFPDHLMPIDQMAESELFALASAADNGLQNFITVPDYEHHLQRLRQVPAWIRQAIANLRTGIRIGVVPPSIIVERTLPMLKKLAATSLESNPFYEPIRRLPASMAEPQRARLALAYRGVLQRELLPAAAQLVDVAEREWLPRGRSTAGLSALPDGAAWYARCLASNTTTTLTADEIHALGLSEVERLKTRMREVQAQFGFTGSLPEFFAWYGQRPETRPFKTDQDVVDAFERLNRRIVPQLPTLFGRVPKAPLEIRLEPELTRDTASSHYNQPAVDGSRPGVFFAVVTDASAYATTGMATLFLHEGQPGHHYQIALAQELDLPLLQRHGGELAFVEGWALYAETLGYPLGLYDDPDFHLGHLSDAMLRAVRLVVDTGLHARGWSREQAISYLSELTGSDERDARAEIERYMVLPGQAVSYAVGRAKIEALRDKAHAALGERFSLSQFHDQVIGSASMPLAVLEAKIDRWVRGFG